MKYFLISLLSFTFLQGISQITQPFDKVAISEYGPYYRDSVKHKVGTFVWNGSKGYVEYQEYAINGVMSITAGILNGGCVDSLGNAYWLQKSTTTFKKIDGTGYVQISAFGDAFVLLKTDGTLALSIQGAAPVALLSTGTKIKKIVASYVIQCLDENKDVWEYQFAPNGSALLPVNQIASTPPKKILGGATDIASGRNKFNFALINGDPWFWGDGWQYVGLNGPVSAPVNMRSVWGLNYSIKSIVCNDDTYHFINQYDSAYGGGNNAQGNVGNGDEGDSAKLTYNNPGEYKYFVKTPVHVGIGRTYKEVFSNNGPFAFSIYALEKNGALDSWGKNKAFNLGNTVTINEIDSKPNYLDVLVPWRVDVRLPQKYYSMAQVNKSNYPPAEAVPPVPPIPVPPVKTVFHKGYFIKDGKRFYYTLYADMTWENKK